jgi:hypothetical protein
MIGQIITDKDGKPVDNHGNRLAESEYQPDIEIKKLLGRVMRDYQVGWTLQHRPFDEFDGYSILDRARKDQETFAAFVGANFVPQQKRWRWQGRKNTARNKLIKTTARALAGMLYPYVYAKNDADEEDKMAARVMRILIEDHLRKAKYEVKFLFMVLSALVNPAVFVEVEYLEAFQTVKQKLANGKIKVVQAVDEIMSGLHLNVLPIDEIMPTDYFSGTGNLHPLPCILRIRRIPYDEAKGLYQGKYTGMKDGKEIDRFDYVKAGMTRIVIAGQDNQTLFDIEWTEADKDYVQEITAYYRSEDLEVKIVGGVFMGNEEDVYNANPFSKRRYVKVRTTEDPNPQWLSVPIYPWAMSGFEPIDPAGRFLWYKSGAFKEYWDSMGEDRMHQLAFDATTLDTIKPVFLAGVASIDSNAMAPGAVVAMPQGASATPYSLGPNLAATLKMLASQKESMDDSINSDPAPATPTPGVTATQTDASVQQSKMFFTVFALMLSDLITQVGGLAMDCVVQYATIGDLDNSVPEALRMRYKSYLAKGKDKGKDVTHRVIFTDKYMGRQMTQEQVDAKEWELYHKSGGENSDQRIYEVNPYAFARTIYTMYVDPDKIAMKSMGTDRQQRMLAFNILTDPRVMPFTDRKAVVDDFAIEEFGGDDPDKYKSKNPPTDEMLNSIMGGGAPGGGGNSAGQGGAPVETQQPGRPLTTT